MQVVLWMTLLLAAGPLAGCYVTSQALHQNDLFNTRRKVSAVLASKETPTKTKAQLEKVTKVLAYAAAQGLNTHGAYEYLIETQQPVVSYIVQAAKDDQLAFITWWFPVIGDVPYLGYFREDERDVEAVKLKAQGYDVSTGGAGAFSSLGWFADPIFSSMLERGDAELAHLFFHELTHRTLWVAGAPAFNENLAEYVAFVLTKQYITAPGTDESKTLLLRYERKQKDKELFTAWLAALKADLTALYAQGPSLGRARLLEDKHALFTRYESHPLKPSFAVADYVGKEDWNNASVLGAALYAPDLPRFARAHACSGPDQSIDNFLKTLKAATARASDPFLALDGLCPQPAPSAGRS